MGLGHLIANRFAQYPLDKDVCKAAEEVVPDFFGQGRKAPMYRAHVLQEYIELADCPPKRDENGEFRSAEQARLDRAWTRVAERMEVSEGTIRNCVLAIYDAEDEERPAKLRQDFGEILDMVGADGSDS